MKLRDLDIIVTAPPAPGWGGRYWILVKVTTDTGITGWGECYASAVGPDAMEAVMISTFGEGGLLSSPFWFTLEGAIIGLIIDYAATRWGGEGPETVTR